MKYLCMIATTLALSGCYLQKAERESYEKKIEELKSIGRFQLIQLGTFRRDQLLLDTATGKVWRSICAYSKKTSDTADCDFGVWDEEQVIGINYTRTDMWEQIKYLKGEAK